MNTLITSPAKGRNVPKNKQNEQALVVGDGVENVNVPQDKVIDIIMGFQGKIIKSRSLKTNAPNDECFIECWVRMDIRGTLSGKTKSAI